MADWFRVKACELRVAGHIGPKKPGFSEKAGLLNTKLTHYRIAQSSAPFASSNMVVAGIVLIVRDTRCAEPLVATIDAIKAGIVAPHLSGQAVPDYWAAGRRGKRILHAGYREAAVSRQPCGYTCRTKQPGDSFLLEPRTPAAFPILRKTPDYYRSALDL